MVFAITADGDQAAVLAELGKPAHPAGAIPAEGDKPDPLGEKIRRLLTDVVKAAPAQMPHGDGGTVTVRWHVHASGDAPGDQPPWVNVTVRAAEPTEGQLP